MLKKKKGIFYISICIIFVIIFSIGSIKFVKGFSIKMIKNNVNINSEKNQEKEKVVDILKKNKQGIAILVNKKNKLSKNYNPKNLVKADVEVTKNNQYLQQVAAIKIKQMFKDAKKDNIELYLRSGYRSSDFQNLIYERNKNNKEQNISKPYYSEHETGLAADISSKSVNFELLQKFEDTKEGKWLSNNSYKYGFILRYKKDREKDTGYIYEPWHFRYVGKNIAKYLYKNDLILEDLYAKR